MLGQQFVYEGSVPFVSKRQITVAKEINIDTINAIVPKILQEDMTGDIIELMNRELPKILRTCRLSCPSSSLLGINIISCLTPSMNTV